MGEKSWGKTVLSDTLPLHVEGEIPAGEGVIFLLEAVFGLMRWPWVNPCIFQLSSLDFTLV
jgi:hypothetical protein